MAAYGSRVIGRGCCSTSVPFVIITFFRSQCFPPKLLELALAVAELEPTREGVPPDNRHPVAVHPVTNVGAECRAAEEHRVP